MLHEQDHTNRLRQFPFHTRLTLIQGSFPNPKNTMRTEFKYNHVKIIIRLFRRFLIFFRPNFLVLKWHPHFNFDGDGHLLFQTTIIICFSPPRLIAIQHHLEI